MKKILLLILITLLLLNSCNKLNKEPVLILDECLRNLTEDELQYSINWLVVDAGKSIGYVDNVSEDVLKAISCKIKNKLPTLIIN